MDPGAGLGMPPLPTTSSAAPVEPSAVPEGAEGQKQHAFLTGWQQQVCSPHAHLAVPFSLTSVGDHAGLTEACYANVACTTVQTYSSCDCTHKDVQ